jgi:hypothetical protein
LQGFHSKNLAFIIEEASAIDPVVFEVAGGALTGANSYEIMCGNPTRTSGRFYDAFHSARHLYRLHSVNCLDANDVDPTLTHEDHVAYAERVALEFGEDSNVYRVRVLGEFPTSEDSAVIPLGLIEAAVRRVVPDDDYAIVWGVDIARFGDDACAVAKRRGGSLLEATIEWRKADIMESVGRVTRMYHETPQHMKPDRINVDVIGMGSGFVDRMQELGLPVYGINVGEASSGDKKRFMRLRDELWWRGREWFEGLACSMPQDDPLISELVQPLYRYESTGKIRVESKQELKDRGIKSPNRADAFLLTFAGGDYLRDSISKMPIATGTTDFDPFEFAGNPAWRSEYERLHGNMNSYDPMDHM